jgi:hypothetical protein
MEEYIQNSLEIIHANEKAYLNELVAYQLWFDGHTYDRFISKLVEVPIIVF